MASTRWWSSLHRFFGKEPAALPRARGTEKASPEEVVEWTVLSLNDEKGEGANGKTRTSKRDRRRKETKRIASAALKRGDSLTNLKAMVEAADQHARDCLTDKERELLLDAKLNASMRDRVIKDTLKTHSDELRTMVLSCLEEEGPDLSPRARSQLAELVASWKEESYAKNVEGEVSSMAFQAAGGAERVGGLNSRVAGETVWAMQHSLFRLLTVAGESAASDRLRQRLASTMRCKMMPTLYRLWVRTGKASRLSLPRSGLLATKWEKEEDARRASLLLLTPDASFSVAPYRGEIDVPNRNPKIHEEKKRSLLTKLTFSVPASRGLFCAK